MKLLSIDPGYNPSNVLTFQVALPAGRYPLAPLRKFAEELVEQLRSVPSVQAAAYGQPPMVAITQSAFFRRVPEVPKQPLREGAEIRLVSRDYLKVMGIEVVAGRGFTSEDRPGRSRVLLINQVLARREFPGENPVGRQVFAALDSIPWGIAGVVEDVRQSSLDREAEPQVFAPVDQWPELAVFPLGPYFSVRTQANPMAVVSSVRRIARQLEAEAGLVNVATMSQIVSNRLSRPQLYAVLLGIFAGIAAALAVIGIYGVMAYSVAQRTREIGIRMALGAQRAKVLWLVLGQSVALTSVGIAIGLAGAAALTRYLQGMLFGLTPLDPTTFVAVAVMFAAVALFAAFVPARRAMKVDPLVDR